MIQTKACKAPIQLTLDMRVRWSSTYNMLDRAEKRKDVRGHLLDNSCRSNT